MDFGKIVEYSGRVSATLILMAVLYAGLTGVIVPGTTYQQMTADRDQWKTLALKGTNLAADMPRGITAAPVAPLPPLPQNPTPDDVKKRLETIEATTQYKTEPSAEPL